MYNRMNRTLLCSSGNSECLILRQREHSALKQSRSSWVLENGEGVTTLGGFRVGTGAALGWGGGGDWLQQASWAWRAQPVLSAGQCAPQWTWWGASSGSSGFKLSSTVRVHPRPGAYMTSGYLQSSDVSTRGHSRGMGPC